MPNPQHITLANGFETCRLLNGMWQVSGCHGRIDPEAALTTMQACYAAGLTTFDLAAHYGPAEDLIGEFRRRNPQARFDSFTKWVPSPEPMTKEVVRQAIQRSLQRMATQQLDLLQFHWWDYQDEAYLDGLHRLNELREEGLIRHLALTNFDTAHVQRIVEAGVPIVTNQVQFSLVDMRPLVKMAPYCREHGIGLLTYGTLCGGLLSEAYLGRKEPGRGELNTASLGKYKQMIDAWGGWPLFQDLLAALKRSADRHQVSIANVATRYILDQPAVAGVIIGIRLGIREHIAENLKVYDLKLDKQDHAEIAAVQRKGRDLLGSIGDCGDEYRR